MVTATDSDGTETATAAGGAEASESAADTLTEPVNEAVAAACGTGSDASPSAGSTPSLRDDADVGSGNESCRSSAPSESEAATRDPRRCPDPPPAEASARFGVDDSSVSESSADPSACAMLAGSGADGSAAGSETPASVGPSDPEVAGEGPPGSPGDSGASPAEAETPVDGFSEDDEPDVADDDDAPAPAVSSPCAQAAP